jgi:D-sedoheptulose 7-phosphate isomerase
MRGAEFLSSIEDYLEQLRKQIAALDRNELAGFAALLRTARDGDRQIFIMGNGGSAATASHFACDFNKGLNGRGDGKYRFICLNDNLPTLTAYANDVGYDAVFVEQLKNFLRAGDLVIGISGSGNSANVVRAVEFANEHGAVTVALTGYDGGRLRRVAQHRVHVDVKDMQIVEDIHMVPDHLSMRVVGRTE